LVHGYYSGRIEFDSGIAWDNFQWTADIDSKAMRKIRPNESLVWMAESRVGAVNVQIHGRVLMMLS